MVRQLDCVGVAMAIMIHVGIHRVEASHLSTAGTHLHVDTVDIHDVDSLHDLRRRELLPELQSLPDECDSVFLMIIPHSDILLQLFITVTSEARE